MTRYWIPLALAWLALGVPAAPQDTVAVVELAGPDGALAARFEVREVDGEQQRHGSYQRWHPGLVPAVEGAYADGLPDGPWKAWHADGAPMFTGAFHEGRRSGKWEFHHANGQLAATGEYLLGCRDRRWIYFDEAGVKLEQESGLYRVERGNHPDRTRAWVGETLEDVRHGSWRTWWPTGMPQTEGAFRNGRRDGALDFFLMDGTRDAQYLSGIYVDGERRDDAVVPTDPFLLAEEAAVAFRGTPAPDPAGLPRAARAPGVKNAERESMREWVRRYAEFADVDERRKAGLLLVQYGRSVVPEVLEAVRALDLTDPTARELGAAFTGEVLRGIAKASFPWSVAEGDEALALDRLAIVRWFSWWELVREDEAYWSAVAAAGEGAGPELFDLRRMDPPPPGAATETATPAGAAPTTAPLFAARRRAAAADSRRAQFGPALDWLARHQDPSGRWNAVGFEQRCEAGTACGGPAGGDFDVGVTALAMLALLAHGDTASAGEYAEPLARALAWLRARHDAATGSYVDVQRHGFLYEHCIATEALCEAFLFDGSPELRRDLERAVQLIHAARNAQGAWRYAYPPDGENDTSVTSWAVSALAAAERAGLAVDPNAYAGARWWIERATDPATGRIGYNSPGSLSARVKERNEHFPANLTEAMSAAGLHVARLLGERHFDENSLERTRGLLAARPPVWSANGFTNDVYYWYHGAQALQGRSDAPSRKWLAALEQALEEGQRRDGHAAGSWDPNGPWGWSGGRVYSTALGALALLADARHAQPPPARKR